MRQKKKMRTCFTWCILAGILFVGIQISSVCFAAFPERPIEIVVKGGPGSGINNLGHLMAKLVPKYLGQSAAVVYKKGGGGAVAHAYLQKRPADGYHVFFDTTTFTIVIGRGKTNFPEKYWQALIRLQVDPEGVAVLADSPWKDFRDLVAWIKKNPGKLRWAGANPIGIDPYTVELLIKAAGLSSTDVKYVPTRGANHMTTMLLGKHVEAAILNPGEAKDQVAAGKFRVLGIGHSERLKDFPDWPTFIEQGFDVTSYIWRGAFVKAGTPAPVAKKLFDAFNSVRQDPVFVDYLKSQSQMDGYMGGPEKFHPWFVEQCQNFRKYFAK